MSNRVHTIGDCYVYLDGELIGVLAADSVTVSGLALGDLSALEARVLARWTDDPESLRITVEEEHRLRREHQCDLLERAERSRSSVQDRHTHPTRVDRATARPERGRSRRR